MQRIKIIQKEKSYTVFAEKGTPLSRVIAENTHSFPHLCGGKGICGKCKVKVDGKDTLSCRYIIEKDITAEIDGEEEILSFPQQNGAPAEGELCLCFDIGTTTLALCLARTDEEKIVKTLHRNNPQRKYGADVMSRIEFALKGGADILQREIISALKEMTEELFAIYPTEKSLPLYISGNTVMLHLFFGADCTKMGTSPYTPAFLESREISGNAIGLEKISKVISLPNISSFMGSDIVAGINLIGMPQNNEHYLFVDLGTNAEIALLNRNKILCTSAAAGPCFEGANISRGMSAVKGAVYAVESDGKVHTVGGENAKGICATGLIDAVSFLLTKGIIDSTGYMECEKQEIAENVCITAEDVRQFQVAKSAVRSAIECLLSQAELTPDKIDKLFVSGGFAHKMNIESACRVGLFPVELKKVFFPVDNSSLRGTLKFASQGNSLSSVTDSAEYTDLSCDSLFSKLFIDNMWFN